MRNNFLAYARPSIAANEIDRVVESLRNGWLTTGPSVKALEDRFVQASGVAHAVALNSCTAALHLGLIALGVGPGDEVVMPSLTFVAGAQCAREIGAIPVFADVDELTLTVTAQSVAAVTTSRTRCIIPMHYAGRPAPVDEIVAFARPRGIKVLEDAAHSVGMLSRGRWAGAGSDAAAFSFYPTKNITSGEGGLLLTNDGEIASRVRRLSLHGMSRDAWKRYTAGGSWQYDVVELGYKYNLPDIGAAIALAQLERLDELQAERERLARHYHRRLTGIPGITAITQFLRQPDRHSWCMFVVSIEEEAGVSRDAVIDYCKQSNIGTSVHYIPTHRFTAYKDLPARLPVTDMIWKRILSLPLYPGMTLQDVDDVVEAIVRVAQSAEVKASVA
ncbi:MAG: DegT/DnrJ/EryC1/StrS family aminotransferase [Vulcanimicrobiaceae bacterium]